MWDPPRSRACIRRSPRHSVARTSTPSRETCAPPPSAAPRAKPGTGAPLPPDRPPTGTGTRARIALAPELDHPHAKLIQTSPPSPSRPLISLPLLLILAAVARSEEHTSELQSRLHLVCRLLLEKKKT